MDGAFYVLREEVTTHDLHVRSQHDIVVRYAYKTTPVLEWLFTN